MSPTNITDPQLVTFTISKEITENQIEQIFSEINAKSAKYGQARLLANFVDIPSITNFKVIFNNFKEKLQSINKVDKYAVITQKNWLENMIKIEDLLIPGLEIHAFHKEEDALEWLDEPTTEETVNIKLLDTNSDQVLGFAIDGKLSAADYDLINAKFAIVAERTEDIRLYIEVIDLEGMTLQAAWEDTKTGFKYYSKITKIAFLLDSDYSTTAEVFDFVTPGIEVQYFPLESKEKALSWLR